MLVYFPTDPSLPITQAWGNVNYALYPPPSGRHMGVDIGGPVGAPIYAASDGQIWDANPMGAHGYGRYIIIQHDNFSTLYAHLHKIIPQIGETVTAGQPIGEMGGQPGDNDPIDGASSGSHLHFEVILPTQPGIDFVKTFAGYTVDPLSWLAKLKYGEPSYFGTVLAIRGLLIRMEPDTATRKIGTLDYKTKNPIIEIVQSKGTPWARLWSIRNEFSAVEYNGELLMSVSPNTPAENPAEDKTARLNEIERMITFLEQRKNEIINASIS